MLDLVIFIFLIFGFLVGLKRGLILQVIHLAGFIISFVVAYIYYDQLAPRLTLWIPYPSFGSDSSLELILDNGNIEESYYRAIAFVVIFFAVKILLQIIGSMLDFVAHLPLIKTLNIWAGGLLGFIENYLIIFIVLYIAALLPIEMIQGHLGNSFLANMMVEHTPYFSEKINDLWIDYKAS